VCVLRDEHPLLGAPWSAKRFAEASRVLVTPRGASDQGVVDDALSALGLSRRITRVVTTFALALQLVRSGDYVVTMQDGVARALDTPGVTLRSPPIAIPQIAMHLLWHASNAHEGRVELLRALMHEALPKTWNRRREATR
jgi:DNA-binding transcriptional LysR family regulator